MPFRGPKHPAWLVGSVATLAILLTLTMHASSSVTSGDLTALVRNNAIPPTFGDSRVFYAIVLALMMIADALAFGALIDNVRFLLTYNGGWREPAKVTVANETILLLAVLFSTVPDVIVLLSWGELMAPPYALLSKLDRAMDGVAAVTFVAYIMRRIRFRPMLLFQLQREPVQVDLGLTWEQLRPKLIIAAVVTVISFGVAFGK